MRKRTYNGNHFRQAARNPRHAWRPSRFESMVLALRNGAATAMIGASPESSPRSSATSVAAPISPHARTARPVCPECKASLNSVPRRFIDRVINIVYPVHRYHCRSFLCGWQGTLRSERSEPDRRHAPEASQHRAHMVSSNGAGEIRPADTDQRPREGDALAAQPILGAPPHAGAGSRT